MGITNRYSADSEVGLGDSERKSLRPQVAEYTNLY